MGLDGGIVAAVVYLFDKRTDCRQSHGWCQNLRVAGTFGVDTLIVIGIFPLLNIASGHRICPRQRGRLPLVRTARRSSISPMTKIGDLAAGINRLTDDLKSTEIKLRRSEQVAAWQMFARQAAMRSKISLMPVSTTVSALQRSADAGFADRAC